MRHLVILCFAVFFFVTASGCRHMPYDEGQLKTVSDERFCEALASLAARYHAKRIDASPSAKDSPVLRLAHPTKHFISLQDKKILSHYDRAFDKGGDAAVMARCLSRLS